MLAFRPVSYGEGLASYFRAVLKQELQKEFAKTNRTKADGTPYNFDKDGLKIYTTIDSRMQAYAEEAQKEWLKQLQQDFNKQLGKRDPFKDYQILLTQGMKRSDRYYWLKQDGLSEDEIKKEFDKPVDMTIFSWKGEIDTIMSPMDSIRYNKLILRNSLMSMEPQTGYVKAWVGGINFEHYKYDQVKMGTRQVGSTAKPFTYAVAIDNGYSPCYQVPNQPIKIGDWEPRAHGSIGGPITLRKALAHSQNFATADIMQQVGPKPVMDLIQRMGITFDIILPILWAEKLEQPTRTLMLGLLALHRNWLPEFGQVQKIEQLALVTPHKGKVQTQPYRYLVYLCKKFMPIRHCTILKATLNSLKVVYKLH